METSIVVTNHSKCCAVQIIQNVKEEFQNKNIERIGYVFREEITKNIPTTYDQSLQFIKYYFNKFLLQTPKSIHQKISEVTGGDPLKIATHSLRKTTIPEVSLDVYLIAHVTGHRIGGDPNCKSFNASTLQKHYLSHLAPQTQFEFGVKIGQTIQEFSEKFPPIPPKAKSKKKRRKKKYKKETKNTPIKNFTQKHFTGKRALIIPQPDRKKIFTSRIENYTAEKFIGRRALILPRPLIMCLSDSESESTEPITDDFENMDFWITDEITQFC